MVDDASGGGAINTGQQGFDEMQDVVLAADLDVDGAVDIPAGTVVDSHMIFLNTDETIAGTTFHFGVTWTFDGAVLGVMSDKPGALEVASSGALDAALTTYPAGGFDNRGIEANPGCTAGNGNDGYSVAGNSITVCMLVIEPGDWIRVVTLVTRPPDCSAAAASPDALWPPNHKFKDITVEGVTDPDGDQVTITVDSIFQDEAVTGRGLGSGNTTPDGEGVGTDTASVRAERNGSVFTPGNGRVYHIGFTAADGNGGTCSSTVTVCVPHDRRSVPACVDEGPLFDSTMP